jgi:hypothetical protein
MLQTYEAIVNEQGNVQFLEPVKLPSGWHVLVTILDESAYHICETALLSESALAEDWERPEEEEAWAHLQ